MTRFIALLRKKETVYPLVFGILFLTCWEARLFHHLFGLELYQLPIPSDIAASIVENQQTLRLYSQYTGAEVVGGFLLGSLLGWIVAVMASFFPIAGGGGVTVVAAMNAIPIVALAPIMTNWFGDGISARIGVVTIMTMTAMTVNAYKGLQSIDPAFTELMHANAASKLQVFAKLRFKHSLPHLFAALKINMTTSFIGAIVGEFFVSSRGLGYLMSESIRMADMPLAWSCIVISSVMGIVLYWLVALAECSMVPWSVRKS